LKTDTATTTKSFAVPFGSRRLSLVTLIQAYHQQQLRVLLFPLAAVVFLLLHSYKPIINTMWVRARLCKLQKRVHSTRSRK
jgi:hypothetical protein